MSPEQEVRLPYRGSHETTPVAVSLRPEEMAGLRACYEAAGGWDSLNTRARLKGQKTGIARFSRLCLNGFYSPEDFDGVEVEPIPPMPENPYPRQVGTRTSYAKLNAVITFEEEATLEDMYDSDGDEWDDAWRNRETAVRLRKFIADFVTEVAQ